MPVSLILPPSLNFNLTSVSIAGVSAPTLSIAISTGISSWASIPSSITLNGLTSGVAGTGAVTGKLTVPANPTFYENAFVSAGLIGLKKSPLCVALSNAISIAFSTAIYTGNSQGVGLGVDTSKVVSANSVSLISILNSTFASNGIGGINAPVLVSAISTGVVSQLMTGFGNGAVLGSPSIAPTVGSSICYVVI